MRGATSRARPRTRSSRPASGTCRRDATSSSSSPCSRTCSWAAARFPGAIWRRGSRARSSSSPCSTRGGASSRTLSGGEQQMLAIARALIARPRLLLLDEPSLGLAPMLAREIFRTIQRINATGVAVLLVEQNARRALRLAGRGYVLETGRVVVAGTSQELGEDPRVRAAYLGL